MNDSASQLRQLARVLGSREFARSERMSCFLEFLVKTTIAGEAGALKERAIGIAVFNRPADWDPKLDNTVRSEARRLRRKLDSYYGSDGLLDPVRISIPVGGYSAEFSVLCSSHPVPEEVAPAEPPVSPLSRRRRGSWITGAMVGAFISLAFVIWMERRPVKARHEDVRVVPFAVELGTEFSPSVSPDGKNVAYVWDGNGSRFDIYVEEISGAQRPVKITDAPGMFFSPAWSPDGHTLAFLHSDAYGIDIMIGDAKGGKPRSITHLGGELSSWASDSVPLSSAQGPTWAPDGQHLLVSEVFRGQARGLSLVDVQTGNRTPLTTPLDDSGDFYPRYSHDGRSIAFVRYVSHGNGDLAVLSLIDQSIRTLTFDRHAIRGIGWSPDDRSLVFASNREGNYHLRLIGLDDEESHGLPSSGDSAAEPSFLPNGRGLIYANVGGNWNIWRTPLSGRGPRSPQQLISSTGHNYSPAYAPNGGSLAFLSDRSETPEIWLANPDGTIIKRLTHFGGGWIGSLHWSPDSKSLAFDARPSGHSEVFTFSLAGGEPVAITSSHFEERSPSWSADGSSLYFSSNRNGPLQVWKYSLLTKTVRPITPYGTYAAEESADGQSLYFGTLDHRFWRCNTDGSAITELTAKLPSGVGQAWTINRDSLYVVSKRENETWISSLHFSDGLPKPLRKLERPLAPGTPGFTISPDDKWLTFSQIDYMTSDIKVRYETSDGIQ